MCGVAGIVRFDGRPVERAVLAAMADRLAHRGPDGSGVWVSPSAAAGFAHRRLSVIDPEPRSGQPMLDPAGRLALTFNGEIYNFRDLRAGLPGDWATDGDTEVLLRHLVAGRPLSGLNGMFAFGLWDEPARTLTLAVDRAGQKPLYVADLPGGVAFASEADALGEVDGWDKDTDDDALLAYLKLGYIPAPRTIWRGVRKLQPGSVWTIHAGGRQQRRWWRPDYKPRRVPAAGEVRGAVEASVRRRLVSDVPLGVFLSGGIDSSIVAAAAKQAGAGEVRTFCVGFDDPRYDERPFARRVADHLGTVHRDAVVTPDLAADLPRLATRFGEPFTDSSLLPTHYLSRFVRETGGMTVALSGDGGDELFGGYDRYRALALPDWLAQTAKLARLLPGSHPKGLVARLRRLAAAADLPPHERYERYVRLFDDAALRDLWPVTDRRLLHGANFAAAIQNLMRGRGTLAGAAAFDRRFYLPGDLHTKVDRASMACALEVRAPFMDPALLTIAERLPGDAYFDGRVGKRLLRDAFAADLPREVFTRRKRGFAVPIGEWFRGELRPMLHDTLTRRAGFCSGRFDPAAVRRLLHEHDTSAVDHAQRLFALLMLELWHDRRSA